MTSEQLDLSAAISNYFDRFCSETTYLSRLASDNGWSDTFARRVLDEYKRFLFIAKEGGHAVTPSPCVDKAWHLHLLYTESYWGDFCPNVLRMLLHHTPSHLGLAQQQKFKRDFQATLGCYREFFGDYPEDIWLGQTNSFSQRNLAWISILVGLVGGSLALWFWQTLIVPSIYSWRIDALIFLIFGLLAGSVFFGISSVGSGSSPKDSRNGNGGSCGGGDGGSPCGGHGSGGDSGGHGGGNGCGGGGHSCGGGCGGGGH
jgi:hypothetical protein